MENNKIDLNKRDNFDTSIFNNKSKEILNNQLNNSDEKIKMDLDKALLGNNKNNTDKPKGGLFANLSNPTKTEDTIIKSSLFGTQTLSGGLFSNLNNQKMSLFNNNPNTGMFNNLTKQDNSDEDDDKKSAESNDFDYKTLKKCDKFVSNYEEIISFEILNFKYDDKDSYGKGLISLEKTKNKEEYIITFRNVFKVLYTGFILKKYSKIISLKNKEEILSGFSFNIEKINDKTKEDNDKKEDNKDEETEKLEKNKIIKNNFKIQFMLKENAEKFKNEFEKYI